MIDAENIPDFLGGPASVRTNILNISDRVLPIDFN
jgi:hypothetical protein